jgi:hypothetical protein
MFTRKIVVGVEDIAAVRLQCKGKCKRIDVLQVPLTAPLPTGTPECCQAACSDKRPGNSVP